MNMHQKILGIVLLGAMSLASAQTTSNETQTENLGKVTLGLHGPEVNFEWALSNQFVWENSFGVGMGMATDGSEISYDWDLGAPTPYLKSELKFLYNFDKRVSKGKNTANNSANYIGLQTKYSFGDGRRFSILNPSLLTDIHWGLQRDLGSKFLINSHIGVGILHDFDYQKTSVSPTFKVAFNYILFKTPK